VVLSKCRRNDGPRQTKILVTNLPETVTAREIVGVYLRRWWIELLMKELKGVVGLGQQQVTSKADRVERGRGGDHGLSAAAQAARPGHPGRPPMECLSPATGLCLGGDAGAV
jgi:hypothetical protein